MLTVASRLKYKIYGQLDNQLERESRLEEAFKIYIFFLC